MSNYDFQFQFLKINKEIKKRTISAICNFNKNIDYVEVVAISSNSREKTSKNYGLSVYDYGMGVILSLYDNDRKLLNYSAQEYISLKLHMEDFGMLQDKERVNAFYYKHATVLNLYKLYLKHNINDAFNINNLIIDNEKITYKI